MSRPRPRFQTMLDILCAGRASTERCLEMLVYVASHDSSTMRRLIAVSLQGYGPVIPVEAGVVDAIQIALRLMPRHSRFLLGYDQFTLMFMRGTLASVLAHTEASARHGLRVARSWTAGARLGARSNEIRPNGMLHWSVTHGRCRWRHAGPPNLTRALLRRRAITGPGDIHLLGPGTAWTYLISSPHPTVALEVLEASPLRSFLAGRVVVGQVAGELVPADREGVETRRGIVF